MSEQRLYIKLDDNGVPETHPILEENLRDVIPNFDPINPPKNFVMFSKTPLPELVGEEVYDYLDYQHSPELTKKNGFATWHEVHHTKTLTKTERNKIIKEFKKLNPDLLDWVYDENTKSLFPPVAKPNDGKTYYWNTDEKKWIESKEELHLDDMIEIAKELGYDLAYGEHGRPPNITEEIVDKIIERAKK